MVATSLRRPKNNFRGILAFDPARDLGAVARLLEEAFRDENAMRFSHIPLMRELGIAAWMLNYTPTFPENISGFVWVEDDRIVGNLTLTRDEGWSDRYFISNIAVQRDHRRRGIARQLVRAALDELRARRARWALLNVRPTNPGAIDLYKEFGFQEIEMRGEWTLTSPHDPNPSPLSNWRGEKGGANHLDDSRGARDEVDVQPLRWSDRSAVVDLMRAAMPESVKKLRRAEIHPYWLYWEDQITELITDFFTGQRTRRWKIERSGKLSAFITLQAQKIFSPHQIEIQVHPDFRGRDETQLVALAMQELAAFPARTVRAVGTSTHLELIAALEQNGFKLTHGLTLMALEF